MPAARKVVQAAGIVLAMNLVSRVLGYVRDAVIAKEFGTSGATDAFMVAYTIPYFLQAILGMAFVMVIVPALAGYAVEGKRAEVWRASSIILNWTVLILSAVALLGMLVSRQLILFMAPGFSEDLAGLARELTVIMIPSIVFMGLGMLVTGILNAHHLFGLPAFAPAANNIIVILAVIFLGSKFGIHGLAFGTLAGFVFFLLIQLPSLRELDFKYEFSFDCRHPALRRAAASIIPIVFGVGVNQIYLALNRAFASMVAVGSIAAIDFAYRLINLPLGIFAASISTVVFPTMSEQAAAGDRDGLRSTLIRGLNLVAFITIPSAVGLMVLHIPVVELLFQRGAFDERATLMTGAALMYFSVGMFGWGANMVLVRAYYAVNDVRTPVITGIFSVVVNVLFSFLFLPLLGHGGLAFANSVAVSVHCLLLYCFLPRHFPGLYLSQVGSPLLRILFASAVMGAVVYLLHLMISLPVYMEVLACVGAGVIAYVLVAFMLRLEETIWIKELAAESMRGIVR